jgi:iron(III) transport system substrate-binding protein
MRNALAALVGSLTVAFTALAAPASAFEIEAERHYGEASAARTLSVLSTTDIDVFEPLITDFLSRHPGVGVRYVMASSQEVFRAIDGERAPFDLVISSAMDLQMKLTNDGHARPLPPEIMAKLPDWARWRASLAAVAQEPTVLLMAEEALTGGLPVPRTRRDLIALLRDNPERFHGRIATYDARSSGVGYFLATQETTMSDTFWRLAEVMGRLDVRLYCCSLDMIEDMRGGELLLAYNVLGSYAASHLGPRDRLRVVELEDFTITLLRTVLMPVNAPDPELATELIDFLVSAEGQRLFGEVAGLPPINPETFASKPHFRPIRLDPGLLAHLDQMTHHRFLEEWIAAMEQP